MKASDVQNLCNIARELVSDGEFEKAYEFTLQIYKTLDQNIFGDNYYILLYNMAANFVDIGGMQPNKEASLLGYNLMNEHFGSFSKVVDESTLYYNLANAKSNLVDKGGIFEQTFTTIEDMVDVKNFYWKAFKLLGNDNTTYSKELKVNLANSLKRQFRVVESISYYDAVISSGEDIPQAWINRSEALMQLLRLSGSHTIKHIREIRLGYLKAIESKEVPPPWKPYYQSRVEKLTQDIVEMSGKPFSEKEDEVDEKQTLEEYSKLNSYQKFVLDNHFVLSEHGMYCPCVEGAKDNLTILPTHNGVSGDFIIPMEMVLNRLKSEYALARRSLFEYEYMAEVDDVACYSELHNGEVLNVGIEKIRNAFRICFGVLDKIAIAICELYDVYPANKIVYFENFWQLNQNGRRDKFEEIKNPALLALYSLATDLNDRKNGELSFYKDWRNDLEHNIVVVHESCEPLDLYNSYGYIDNIRLISESDFTKHFKVLLQIVRSAIFLFTFMVRNEGRKRNVDSSLISNSLDWKI